MNEWNRLYRNVGDYQSTLCNIPEERRNCLIKIGHHAVHKSIDEVVPKPLKHVEEEEVELHSFLTSALDGSEWSASYPCRFTPRTEPLVPVSCEVGWAHIRYGHRTMSGIESEFLGRPACSVVTISTGYTGSKVNKISVGTLKFECSIALWGVREATERRQCAVESPACKRQDGAQILVLPEPEANSYGKREVKVTSRRSDMKRRWLERSAVEP
jgi:hypothetical protein